MHKQPPPPRRWGEETEARAQEERIPQSPKVTNRPTGEQQRRGRGASGPARPTQNKEQQILVVAGCPLQRAAKVITRPTVEQERYVSESVMSSPARPTQKNKTNQTTATQKQINKMGLQHALLILVVASCPLQCAPRQRTQLKGAKMKNHLERKLRKRSQAGVARNPKTRITNATQQANTSKESNGAILRKTRHQTGRVRERSKEAGVAQRRRNEMQKRREGEQRSKQTCKWKLSAAWAHNK